MSAPSEARIRAAAERAGTDFGTAQNVLQADWELTRPEGRWDGRFAVLRRDVASGDAEGAARLERERSQDAGEWDDAVPTRAELADERDEEWWS